GATAPLPQHRPRGDGMDKTSNLPLALWQANLDLQMRLGQLLQDGGRQWLEQGTRTAGEGAAEFDAQARKLLQAGDWPALAALPDWQRQAAKAWSAASIDAGAVPGIDGSWQAMQSNLEQAIAAMMQTGAGGAGSRKRGG